MSSLGMLKEATDHAGEKAMAGGEVGEGVSGEEARPTSDLFEAPRREPASSSSGRACARGRAGGRRARGRLSRRDSV